LNEPATLYETRLQSVALVQRGKVRDIYRIGKEHLLIVTTDRISAFDVVLPDPIPGKGAVLTAVSSFWFERMADLTRNHMTEVALSVVLSPEDHDQVVGRAVVVKRYRPLPIEAIVRGYLIGSGWKDYQKTGAVCGIALPSGLAQAARLPSPIFTPSTKAEVGKHDLNIGFEEVVRAIGREVAERVRDVSLAIYARAAAYAAERGIIIADTKFEFGLDEQGELVLIDELLTPDSSRFWPADAWRTGVSPPSFDKQFVRDYLETLDWDKTPPGPRLPPDVIEQTAAKYREAEKRLCS
jgi:phosphoribosylaminoimidazole-succinocarboxamide synthase